MAIDPRLRRWPVVTLVIVAIVALIWWFSPSNGLPDGIVGGNGRVEATEIDIAAKIPGRVQDIAVREGDFVKEGQVLARIDADSLKAQKAEAEATLQAALSAIATARTQVAQRQSDRAAALAVVRQREAELSAAQKRLDRTKELTGRGFISLQTRDDDEASFERAKAAVAAARAQLAALDSAVTAARSQVRSATSNAEAARATIKRLDVDIADCTLKAPRNGRIQYRIAEPGEIVGSGGSVLNLVDLADVYMTFFLPETVAGKVRIGSEVRLVIDALPDYVLPAKVTFVADVAQFTPKTVETESEREKLMFRVKAQLDPDLLRSQSTLIKTGLPGMAYLKVDPDAEWPDFLTVKTPQ